MHIILKVELGGSHFIFYWKSCAWRYSFMHTPDFGTTPDRSLPSFELSSSTALNNLGNIDLVFPVKTPRKDSPAIRHGKGSPWKHTRRRTYQAYNYCVHWNSCQFDFTSKIIRAMTHWHQFPGATFYSENWVNIRHILKLLWRLFQHRWLNLLGVELICSWFLDYLFSHNKPTSNHEIFRSESIWTIDLDQKHTEFFFPEILIYGIIDAFSATPWPSQKSTIWIETEYADTDIPVTYYDLIRLGSLCLSISFGCGYSIE
jgi:hypothetical protein